MVMSPVRNSHSSVATAIETWGSGFGDYHSLVVTVILVCWGCGHGVCGAEGLG